MSLQLCACVMTKVLLLVFYTESPDEVMSHDSIVQPCDQSPNPQKNRSVMSRSELKIGLALSNKEDIVK